MGVKHTVRHVDGDTIEIANLTPSLAIKILCTECNGGDHPKLCTAELCPVFPFRGRSQKATGSREKREANPKAMAALKKAREAKKGSGKSMKIKFKRS